MEKCFGQWQLHEHLIETTNTQIRLKLFPRLWCVMEYGAVETLTSKATFVSVEYEMQIYSIFCLLLCCIF